MIIFLKKKEHIFIFIAMITAIYFSQNIALASNKMALIIGNSDYLYTTKLKNATNDATKLASILRTLDFDVLEGINLKKEYTDKAILEFRDRIEHADVALFFYAGHAIQINGDNYILPVDAAPKDTSEVQFQTVNLNIIMEILERRQRTNLVFMDACRDNPFARDLARNTGRSRNVVAGRGLAPPKSGVGTLIAYATAPDDVASDGDGSHSPFTAALIEHIATPGLEVRQMLSRVRKSVLEDTKGAQIPWDHSSLTDDFFFVPEKPSPSAEIALIKPRIDGNVDSNSRPFIHNCDLMAAYRFDPDKVVPGLLEIKAGSGAVPTCREAVSKFPNERRFKTQLGMALDKAGQSDEALEWFKKAADQGSITAQSAIGSAYLHGRGVKQNYGEALKLFRRAAEQGSAHSQGSIGAVYLHGLGVTRDYEQAFIWHERAAKQGFPLSQTALGWLYQMGNGVEKNSSIAAEWYMKAAEQDEVHAQYSLGWQYENGEGVTPIRSKAIFWYRKAASQGNEMAKEALRRFDVSE